LSGPAAHDVPVVLGIDAGTTSVKTVAFGMDGRILSVAKVSVGIARNAAGAAESDMDEVWAAAATTVRDAVAGVPGADVRAIGVTGQGDGAWFLDGDDRPVAPAALWLDGRATTRVERWSEDARAEAVRDATGSPLFAGALPVLVEELTARDGDLFDRVALQLNCKDWLRFQLTGDRATDVSEASRTYLDTRTLRYSDDLLERLDQRHVAAILPPVRNPYERAGALTSAAAEALGLPAGVPVAVGLVDSAACAVGLGAVEAGDGCIVLGTTSTVAMVHASRADRRTDFGIILATGRGTQVVETFSTMSGTPNLDWARQALRLSDGDWRDVEADAAAVPPGSGGVIYLPYGSPSGERAPFVDVNASASWHGTNVTTPPAALLRSVYEGLAHSLTECLDLFGIGGEIAICGGGSDSDLMCRILADVSGRRIRRQADPEAGARGAATVALVATGHAADLAAAIDQLRPATTTFEPQPDQHRAYRRAHRAFLDIRAAARTQWAALRELRDLASAPPAGSLPRTSPTSGREEDRDVR
jgi:erythritol kinase (D-erythritol 1-phosphate-forming)